MKEKLEAYLHKLKTQKKPALSDEQKEDRIVHGYLISCLVILMLVFGAVPAYAAGGDPIETINNLSTFIFSAIRAIGIIILGFGVVQIGLSLKSHDASQRANGFLTFFGGVIITFAKNILDLVVG